MASDAGFALLHNANDAPAVRSRSYAKVIAAVTLVVGVAAVVFYAARPAHEESETNELKSISLTDARDVVEPAEVIAKPSDLGFITSVHGLNDLLRTSIVTDPKSLYKSLDHWKLFNDFLETMGTEAPLLGALRPNSKTYASLAEHERRFGIFQGNLQTILEQNAEEYAHNPSSDRMRFGLTVHADWTVEEFETMRYSMGATNVTEQSKGIVPSKAEFSEASSSISCSQVTSAPVRNQGSCGDCWAFSTVEQLRFMYFHKYKRDIGVMSAQYLVDCDPDETNLRCKGGVKGCCGGLPIKADIWLAKSGGCPTQAAYGPLLSDKHPNTRYKCKSNVAKAVLPHGYNWWHTETDIANGYCSDGGVSIAIAANSYLMHYVGGIITARNCPANQINHAVLDVGVDKYWDNHKPVHIVINSWGENWGVPATRPYKHKSGGRNGHMIYKFGENVCNIKRLATAPQSVTAL